MKTVKLVEKAKNEFVVAPGELVILRGLPASGKSTYARKLVEHGYRRINRDDIRAMLDNSFYSKDTEVLVRELQDHAIRTALQDGWPVVDDNSNLVPQTVKRLHAVAASVGNVNVIEKPFNVPIAECLARNAAREGVARVPDKAIYDMAKDAKLTKHNLEHKETYYPALVKFNRIQDETLPKAIICDLDGTLALHYGRNPYDAAKCANDAICYPVLDTIRAVNEQGKRIIFVSGRSDKYKPETIQFLLGKCGFYDDEYTLLMRKESDKRKDSIVKKEIYEQNILGKYLVEFVLDDRPSVIRMWRYELGLTVFALNDKEF